MAHKSIVDRVLILAAAICAAALVWQLTVLLTSKGRTSSGGSLMAVASAPRPTKADVAQSTTPTPPAIRVVYSGTEPSTKTSVKASDPPVPATEPASASTRPDPLAVTESPASSSPAGTSDQTATGPLALASTQPADTVPPDGAGDQTASTALAPGGRSRLQVATAEQPATGDETVASKPTSSGAINLNHASIESLNHLKGAGHIGQAIVSHRPYRSVEDLVKKRVLRRDVYEQIKQMVGTE